MIGTVCPSCGTPHDKGTPCPHCTPPRRDYALEDRRRGTARQRGYDAAWRRLSERARRLQPFCTDCGTTERLTVDHSPTAWDRHDRGLPIRLQDVAVVCDPCNQRRGPARGPNATPRTTVADLRDDLDRL